MISFWIFSELQVHNRLKRFTNILYFLERLHDCVKIIFVHKYMSKLPGEQPKRIKVLLRFQTFIILAENRIKFYLKLVHSFQILRTWLWYKSLYIVKMY